MKTIVTFVAAVLLAAPALASHVPPRPGCFYNGHDAIICTPCVPPDVMEYARCVSPPVPPPVECRILVRYWAERPQDAKVEEPAPSCDRAALEWALAAALARLLGAP